VMDWTHPEETTNKHHSPGPDLESSGEEKERSAQELLDKAPGGRHQADRLLLGGAGADCLGPWTLAVSCG
jgi:hypothetical protein